MKPSSSKVKAFLQNRSREVLMFGSGIAVAVAFTAAAQYATPTQPSQPCPLDQAAQDAVNNKVQLIGMTTPDPGKYFNLGSPDNCMSGLSMSNLDLSRLIPDPFGLLSGGVSGAMDNLKKLAMGAACLAVRNSVADQISKYNSALWSVNQGVNLKGKTDTYIDTKIGDLSRSTLNGYSVNWKTPTSADVLTGVPVKNAPVTLPTIPSGIANTPVGQQAQTTIQGAANSVPPVTGTPSSVAGGLFK